MAIHDSDMNEIVRESQKRIKNSLIQGFEYDHLVIVKSNEFLRKHDSQRIDFPVMYVDLVESSKMSTELSPEVLSRIITVFSQETAFVIEHFGGYVLKFVGDTAIGYFPSQGTSSVKGNEDTNHIDRIILCGDTIVQVVRNAINPLLLAQGYYKGIEVKVTADYGEHTIVRYGSDKEKSHIDIISATMNLAAKMQSLSRASQMIIGYHLFVRLSKEIQEKFSNADVRDYGWTYRYFADSGPYDLYMTKF